MGRVLQKKKNRSSISKVKHKPKSKKKILDNPIIAANWNQKETLSQNYRRLGLSARLNHATGGTEKTIAILASDKATTSETNPTSDIVSDKLRIPSKLPKTFAPLAARVERDPKTGKILRVLDDPTASKKPNPLNDPLNEFDDESDTEGWNGFAHVPSDMKSATQTVQALAEQASSGVRKAPRRQSAREEDWIQRLVEKYGDDYKAMFRDGKLNPMQQSEGDIKRRVTKWRENHL
ncbi:60S ribosomal subunit biogenesis protein-like protein Nop16 [Lepidopterella palustris CBS 459.81]|uniref:Nucleolar protein 16 n=1 Tax=Lepidopterella palustris CBS 459.81 TaxID=1314670 RepID=A0A8E2JJ81_9PEZI|nr:60S ribosomal subunit biogenesis protein-like protein Nop16 [Lepidopterella palustris CBS 459.81]